VTASPGGGPPSGCSRGAWNPANQAAGDGLDGLGAVAGRVGRQAGRDWLFASMPGGKR
jgi:hypothetical protein